jgi:hypothetical protein
MPADIRSFLADVRSHLHLDAATRSKVISELETHFDDKVTDLKGEGLSEREAVDQAIVSFGQARDVARLMYEAYSRGTWTEALVSLQPHILVASLFATHLWREPLVLGVVFAAISAIAILGCRGGAPIWTYSFAGYAFLPPLLFVYLFRGAPREIIADLASGEAPIAAMAKLAGLLLVYGATLLILVTSTVRSSRSDWIPVSLMFLPLVVVGVWAHTVEQAGDLVGGILGGDPTRHGHWDRSMAWLCTALGLSAAAFVRTRARLIRGVAVVAIGIVTGGLALRSMRGELGLRHPLGACLLLLLVLMSPLLIHRLLDRSPERPRQARELHAS